MKLIAVAALASLVPAVQGVAAEGSDGLDPVSVFNQVCYSKVPSTKAIEDMALELGWKFLSPSEMTAFGTPDQFSYFKGWDMQIGEVFYRVGLTQRDVDGALGKQFPDFSNGTATSCTMVLGDEHMPEEVAQNLQKLVGKEPVSSGVQEGSVTTTTWAGGNEKFKVFLFNKVSRTDADGLVTVTIVSR